MKRVIILANTLLILSLFLFPNFTLAASKGEGPIPSATGSFGYYSEGYYFEFNAHAEYLDKDAKGEAFNYAPGGLYYRAEVRYATVLTTIPSNTFLFAAELVETNAVDWGPWVLIQVQDNGTPGTEGDLIWGQFLSQQDAIDRFVSGTSPTGGPWPLLSGNLVVHLDVD